MTRKFGIVALAVIMLATIAGGMVEALKQRPARVSGSTRSIASADIKDDYQEGVAVIGREYAGDVDYEKATQAAIQGMLTTLDPHSVFFPRAEFNKLRD